MYHYGSLMACDSKNPPELVDLYFLFSRCMQLALVHDLAECIVGDITPHCGVGPDEKQKREDKAMQELVELIGPSGTLLYDLFKVIMLY